MELIKVCLCCDAELPASQRPELEREINGLISDMLEGAVLPALRLKLMSKPS